MSRAMLSALAVLVALALALLAQQAVTSPVTAARGGWLFLAAALCFIAGLAVWPEEATAEPENVVTDTADWECRDLISGQFARAVLLTLTLSLAFLAYRQSAFNALTSTAVFAWLGATVAFVAATVKISPARLAGWQVRLRLPWRVSLRRHHLALLLILLLAIGFRTYRLASVPAELGSDQAEKLLDVNDVLNGLRPIFFPRNTGREAFQFYLTALLIRTTPLTLSHLALKVGTVLVSLFALPWAYLLGKELFDRRLGLLVALLLAMSQWHVAISRVGLRFPFTAAFATPTLYFFFRALRLNRRNDWLAAGLFLGVGLHTYIPMRIVPLLLLALAGLKLLLDWLAMRRGAQGAREVSEAGRRFWVNSLLGACLSFLVFLPLFRFMVDRPDLFWYRVTSRSSDALGDGGPSAIAVFLDNVRRAALMFNVQGDVVFSNTVPFSPVLDDVTAALFVLGLAYLLWRLLWRGDRRSLYVLVSLFMLLLPSTLSIAFPGENPSVVRAGGAIPIAMLIAALPLWWIWRRLPTGFGKRGAHFAFVLIAALMAVAARENATWYFERYDRQFRLAIWNASDMGRVVRGFSDSLGDLGHAYHVAYPYWVDTRAIGINAGDINWHQRAAILDLTGRLPEQEADPAAKLYLLHTADAENLALLEAVYPEGRVRRFRSSLDPGKDFLIFFVPARQ